MLFFSVPSEHLLIVKNIDDFENLNQSTKTYFDIIAVSESRITKNKLSLVDISIPNYSHKFCPTEDDGTLIYIRNHWSYNTKNDLNIYKYIELEPTFIEICNPKNKILLLNVSINTRI